MKNKKIFILLIMICLLCTLSGCAFEKASNYTDEEHMERVIKRIEKRYFQENSKYTSYEIYPIYNELDQLKYFVVDFEPSGFVYVYIRDEVTLAMKIIGTDSLYLKYEDEYWIKEIIKDHHIDYEKDENGEYIKRYHSHFKEANIINQKRYLLDIYQDGDKGIIPAIKNGDKYINIISMEEFDYQYRIEEILYPTAYINLPPKKMFML